MATEDHSGIDWSLTTWEGARREQHRAFMQLSLREKLQALEDHCDLARHFEARRRQQGRSYTSIDTGAFVSGLSLREEPPPPPAS